MPDDKLLDRTIKSLIVAAVVGGTVVLPLVAWIGNRFFDWQLPAFLQSVVDYF